MEEFEEFKEFREFKEDRTRTFNYLLKDGRTPPAEDEIRFECSGRADCRLLELLRVFILARRLLNGCGQFWSIVWGPWVGFKMGLFQSPDLRIAEAKNLIDL